MQEPTTADEPPNAAASAADAQVGWPIDAGMRPSLKSSPKLKAEAGLAQQPVTGPCEAPGPSLRRSLFRQ